jgi:hypothetical protein
MLESIHINYSNFICLIYGRGVVQKVRLIHGNEKPLELITLKDMSREFKVLLLKELGLGVDGDGYVTKEGHRVLDKYIEQPVRLDNMAIFPGSSIVLDDNPLSIALYFDEYGEV